MEVQNFVPFCYWKGVNFTENIHVILQKWPILECVTDTLEVNPVHRKDLHSESTLLKVLKF